LSWSPYLNPIPESTVPYRERLALFHRVPETYLPHSPYSKVANFEEKRITEASRAIDRPLPPVFRAVVRTVVPESADLDEAGWTELENLVQTSLADRPPALRRRLFLFMRLVQWLPLLHYGRPFSSLDPGRRARLLDRFQNSRVAKVRLGLWGLRTLAFLGYYGRPDAARAIGYTPDPRGWDAS
jgi:hypothetical protein